jgi:RNA 2',3'-cyclic 3'-phosphodiesterase
MRLFVAIDLSDAQRAEAARAADVLQRVLESARAPRAIRWVAPAALHLTVRFIGEVDEEHGGRIVAELARPLDVAPFQLALGNVGTFPPSGVPRVVWVGVGDGLAGASAAHHGIETRLTALGVPAEARRFRPHLTLGRVRDIRRSQAAALVKAVRRLRIDPAPALVDCLTLYRSYLSPKGPRYEPLTRTPLTG